MFLLLWYFSTFTSHQKTKTLRRSRDTERFAVFWEQKPYFACLNDLQVINDLCIKIKPQKYALSIRRLFFSFNNHDNDHVFYPSSRFRGWCTCSWILLQQFTAVIEMKWVFAGMLCHCPWLCSSLSSGDGRLQLWSAAGLLSSRLVWPLTSPSTPLFLFTHQLCYAHFLSAFFWPNLCHSSFPFSIVLIAHSSLSAFVASISSATHWPF